MDKDSKDNAIRNQSLIDQIDSLDDDNGAIKFEKKGKGKETPIIIGLLSVIVIAAIIYISIESSTPTQRIGIDDITDEIIANDEEDKDLYIKDKDVTELYDNLEDDFEIIDDSKEYDNDEYYEDYYDDYYYNDDEYYYEDDSEKVLKEKFENQKNNLVIQSEGFDTSDDLTILLKNNNIEPIEDIDVYAVFFDGENNIVDVNTDIITYVSEGAVYPILFTNTPKNFETYKIYMKKDYFYESNYENYTDKIEFETEIGKDDVIIKAKNNSDKKIEYIDFAIVYYDENDNILDVALESEYDIRKGQSFEIEAWKPYNPKTFEDLDFSRCEVSIIGAYNYID